jgi:hypothetical protein
VRLSYAALDWLIETRRIVDQIAAAEVPDFGWCGTSRAMGWDFSPANDEIRRVFKRVGLIDLLDRPEMIKDGVTDPVPRAKLIEIAPQVFVDACRALQDLQPLYLIPRTQANAPRIAAQARLVCSLYRLAVRLVGIEEGDDRDEGRLFQGKDPLMSKYSAYLLAELETAKKAGVVPLAATEVLTLS